MDLSFGIALVLYLDLYSDYFRQKSIGNRKHSDKMIEALETLQIYVMLLEYNASGESFLEEEDVKKIYNNFKQLHYSIKSVQYE